ncbi:MAG TPA: TrmJ/YjtD family RNA methyltransferase [Candidatus Bathyarchaeia archaeon]|nr:TrmJ/YjtD family RNA methyltransferase [Candidatus Bathyarchaeia archaeon]
MPSYRVVLVEPAFEESIGFVARAMKNFGISSLHLVNPLASLGETGHMRGGHAQDLLDLATIDGSIEEALQGVDLTVGTSAQKSFSEVNLLRKTMTVKELRSSVENASGIIGLVFGREGTGLTNQELGLCDCVVTIPTASEYHTLNLSHAAAIVFYELYDEATANDHDLLASEDVKKTILGYLQESARLAGVEEYRIRLAIRSFRNVMGRSALRWREGSLLAGTLRHISEALSRTGSDQSRLGTAGEIVSAASE